MKTWTVGIGSFILGMILGFSIPFNPHKTSTETSSTNAVVQVLCETNQEDRANYNVNTGWFTDNSKYIWDGWKIK